MERMAIEPDRGYAAGGAVGLFVPAAERTSGSASYPVWAGPVHQEHMPCCAEPYVPGWLQSQIVGVQLLFPEKPCKYLFILSSVQLMF
jgi:hypothetical protein